MCCAADHCRQVNPTFTRKLITVAFFHTPAYTITIPDTHVDPTIDRQYKVVQDLDAEDPREWIEDSHVALYVYNGPRGHKDPIPDNRIAEVFDHFYKIYDDEKALAATKRWLTVFYPEIAAIVEVEISNIQGYSQGDWLDVLAVVTQGYGSAASHINEFRQWVFGDVWTVSDGTDTLSGIYADDQEQAVEFFLLENPVPFEAMIFDNPFVEAFAHTLYYGGNPTAARWLHAHPQFLSTTAGTHTVPQTLDAIVAAAEADRKDIPA